VTDIQLEEKNGDLVVTAPRLTFTVEPVPAKHGAKMLAHFLEIAFDGGMGLSEDDVANLYERAVGKENIELAEDTLRRQVYLQLVNAIVWWQVAGIGEARTFLAEGMKAALETHFAQSGLSLSTILSLLGEGEKTPAPEGTNATSTPSGSKTASKTGARKKKPSPKSDGKTSSSTGTQSNATSTSTTESTGQTKST